MKGLYLNVIFLLTIPGKVSDVSQATQQSRDLSRMEQDRDRQWNNGSVASLESRIRQSVPKSQVSVTMKDWKTVVLSGVVASKRDRQTIEQMVHDQDPRMQVVDNVQIGNVGPFGETPSASHDKPR